MIQFFPVPHATIVSTALALGVAASLIGSPAAAQSPDAPAGSSEDAVTSLFDGQTLEGWSNPYPWGKAEVSDGQIHLTSNEKFFLVTDRVFHDYEFEGEIKLPPGKSNSGIMARGQVAPQFVYGYQAEADPTDRKWSGGLYDEGRRQWLNPLWEQPEAQAAFDRDRWNRYRIRCVGNHLQFFVNDVPTTDYFDPADLSGRIGLQHHGEDGQTYRFRNLNVRDLGRHEWVDLFDGKTLDGWKKIGGGNWNVVDGVIQGRTERKADQPHGLLYSKELHRDGTYRLEYRVATGDSGFYVRGKILDANPFIAGVQAEVDDTAEVAGLYQTGGKGWLVRPLHYLDQHFPKPRRSAVRQSWQKARRGIDVAAPPKSAGNSSEPDGQDSKADSASDPPWQTMVINVHGNRIVTHLNGCLASDHVVEDLEPEGVIALQLHSKQDVRIDIRSVQMLQPVTHESSRPD